MKLLASEGAGFIGSQLDRRVLGPGNAFRRIDDWAYGRDPAAASGQVGLNGHERSHGQPRRCSIQPALPRERRFRHRRIVVTGGAGFVGSHLVETLAERGDTVTIIDDLSSGRFENISHMLGESVSFVEGSITDARLVDECLREVDICVHLVADVDVELIGRRGLYTEVRAIRGSDVVLRSAEDHGVRALLRPRSETDRHHDGYSPSRGPDLMDPRAVRPTVVRLFDTIGPRKARSRDLVGGFVRQALAGECLTVPGTGEQRRCFTHVFDVVEALMLLCDHTRAAGGAYEIGNPAAVSILELAERVLERTGSNSPIRLVPEVAAPEAGLEERGLDVPDTAPLHALTGWTPRQTLDAAIEDVIVHQSAARLSLN